MENVDHDLLIRIDTRMDVIERELKDLRLGIIADIAKHDVRLRVMEDSRARFDPALLVPKYDLVAQEWNDFKVRRAVWGTVVILGGALAGNFFRLVVFPLIGIKP
jgi:hypothetical protein